MKTTKPGGLPLPPPEEALLPFVAVVSVFRDAGFDFTQATAGMVFVYAAIIMPGCSQSELCKAIGLSKPVVSRTCALLVEQGLIETTRNGHVKCCKPTKKGAALARRVLSVNYKAITASRKRIAKRHGVASS